MQKTILAETRGSNVGNVYASNGSNLLRGGGGKNYINQRKTHGGESPDTDETPSRCNAGHHAKNWLNALIV